MPEEDSDYGAWWSSDDGRALLAHLHGDYGRDIAAGVRAVTGIAVEPQDVAGHAIIALAPSSPLRAGVRAPTTRRPARYLARCLLHGLARSAARREESLEAVLPQPPDPRDPRPPRRLEIATRRVASALHPATPPRLQPTLPTAVERVVDAAADRGLSRLATRLAADPALRQAGWSPAQTGALVTAIVGTAPDRAVGSLLGAALFAAWHPAVRAPIPGAARIIGAYSRRMRSAEPRVARLAGAGRPAGEPAHPPG